MNCIDIIYYYYYFVNLIILYFYNDVSTYIFDEIIKMKNYLNKILGILIFFLFLIAFIK